MKSHGLKFQTGMLPNGIWASCFGASQRHNDLGMLSLLVLPDQLISYFIELGIRLGDGESFPALYGNSIFFSKKC